MRFFLIALHGLVAVLIGHVPIALADDSPTYFAYSPQSPMSLGHGFVQNDLSKTFAETCLTWTSKDDAYTGSGTQFATISASVVRDYSSLLDKMGVDARVGAHSPAGGFDARFNLQRSSFKNSTNITIVVQAYADYGKTILQNVDWKPEFKQLIQQGGQWKDIITRCGARFPLMEQRAVKLSAMITFSDLSAETRQVIDTSMSGNYGSGALTASASLAINSEYKQATEQGRVNVEVYAAGGDASTLFEQTIKSAIKTKLSIDEVGDALAKFANGLTKDKAATVGFFVTDMPLLDVAREDPWNVEKEHRIETIAAMYFSVSDKRNQLDAIVGKSDPRYRAYSAQELAKFAEDSARASHLLDGVLALLGECKQALPPNISPCDIPDTLIASANELRNIPLLEPPSGGFRVAVKDPPPEDTDAPMRWHLLSDDDSALVMKSVARRKGGALIDYSPTAEDFHEDFLARVRGQSKTAERAALGFLLSSDHLDTIEEITRPADEVKFPEGTPDTIVHGKIWEKGHLGDYELSPDSELSSDEDFRDGRQQYAVWLDFDFLTPPPESPGCVIGKLKTPACTAYTRRYFESLPIHIEVLPTLEMAAAVKHWILSGKVLNGKGTVSLRAHDTYSGEREFELLSFEWETDDKLQVAKVKYHFGKGEENVWYVTGLGPRSKEFPLLTEQWQWTIPANNAEAAYDFPAIEDKWHDFEIKYCTPLSVAVPLDSEQSKTGVVSLSSTDRKTAHASFSKKPVPRPFLPGKPYVYDIKLIERVETTSSGLFGPGFYDSDNGCELKGIYGPNHLSHSH